MIPYAKANLQLGEASLGMILLILEYAVKPMVKASVEGIDENVVDAKTRIL